MRFVVVAPGDPQSPATWSGSTRFLLEALKRSNVEVVPVNGRPTMSDRLEIFSSISTSRAASRQRFHSRTSVFGPVARAWWTRHASRALGQVDGHIDAVLQIGAWYDLTDFARSRRIVSASYNDGNIATYLSRADLAISRTSVSVRRALEAERDLSHRLDVILCMSDWARDSFITQYGVPAAKVSTVSAGANLTHVPDLPGPRSGPPRLLFVGKGDFGRKGGHELLSAFQRVRAAREDAELWIVGQDGEAQPGVRWFGLINRREPDGEALITRLYRDATIYVMPSRYEPFGIAFLEAMAYGLPCIGSDACAMPGIIEHGETGYVVPLGDVDILSRRILEIAGDPVLASRMGDLGRARVTGHFTWDAVALRIVDVIDRAAGAKERAMRTAHA